MMDGINRARENRFRKRKILRARRLSGPRNYVTNTMPVCIKSECSSITNYGNLNQRNPTVNPVNLPPPSTHFLQKTSTSNLIDVSVGGHVLVHSTVDIEGLLQTILVKSITTSELTTFTDSVALRQNSSSTFDPSTSSSFCFNDHLS